MERIPFDPYDFFGHLASGLVLVVGMQIVLGFPEVIGHEFGVVDSAVLLLGIYVAGQIAATPAKALLEDGIVRRVLEKPSVNLFRERRPRIRGFLFSGFYVALPIQRRKRIQEKARLQGITVLGEDLFLHVRFCEEIRSDDRLLRRLDSFLNKYGFSRNLSFATGVVGIGCLMKFAIGGAEEPMLTRYGYTALVVCLMLFYRYLKFFRQYSFELFNTFGGK